MLAEFSVDIAIKISGPVAALISTGVVAYCWTLGKDLREALLALLPSAGTLLVLVSVALIVEAMRVDEAESFPARQATPWIGIAGK